MDGLRPSGLYMGRGRGMQGHKGRLIYTQGIPHFQVGGGIEPPASTYPSVGLTEPLKPINRREAQRRPGPQTSKPKHLEPRHHPRDKGVWQRHHLPGMQRPFLALKNCRWRLWHRIGTSQPQGLATPPQPACACVARPGSSPGKVHHTALAPLWPPSTALSDADEILPLTCVRC